MNPGMKKPRPGGNRAGRDEHKNQPGRLTRQVYNSPTNPVTAGELLEDIEKIEQALQEVTQ